MTDLAVSEDLRPPLNVADLLDQFRLETAEDLMQISGKALQFSLYPEEAPQYLSGLLSDPTRRGLIRFRCPFAEAPEFDGQYVVIEGRLAITPARGHGGLEMVLHGRKIAAFTPNAHDAAESYVAPPRRAGLRKLDLAMATVPLTRVGLMGSPAALAAARAGFEQLGMTARWLAAPLRELEADHLLYVAERLAERVDILCWVQEGAEPGLLALGNDPLVIGGLLRLETSLYVALGRPADLTLADRWADESFSSPGAFGAAVAGALVVKGLREEAAERLARTHAARIDSERANRSLELARDDLAEQLRHWQGQNRRIRIGYRMALAGLLALVLLAALLAMFWSPLLTTALALRDHWPQPWRRR